MRNAHACRESMRKPTRTAQIVMAAASSEFCQYLGDGFKLKNRTFIVRHGLAESNVKQVLVTKPDPGTTAWGLVDEGKKQAEKAGEKLRGLLSPMSGENVIVVSSDFTRTRETAEIIHRSLDVKTPLRFEIGLRERDMGDMDLLEVSKTMTPNLFDLWKKDENDLTTTWHNAESVDTIARRMSSVVKTMNREYEGKAVILVSHQDPLHILHSLFVAWPLAKHKKTTPPIVNCDVRELLTK